MLIRFVLGIASLLSLSFSLLFWASLGTGVLQGMLLTLALVLEASKWLAWRHCQQFLRLRRLSAGFCSGALFLVLLALSVLASSLQLNNSYLRQKESAVQGSQRYQNLAFQIAQQRAQIAALLESAQDDLKNGYRRRAQDVLKHDLAQAQNVLGHLIQEQSAENTEVQNVPLHALMQAVSRLCGRNMELILCFVLGALLDVVISFLFWFENNPMRMCSGNIRGTRNNFPPANKRDRKKEKTEMPILDDIKGDHSNVVSLLKKNRCSPTVRAIKGVAKIGTQKAQALLESMAREGLLVRKNLRYQLA
jgi:hypothetical protein